MLSKLLNLSMLLDVAATAEKVNDVLGNIVSPCLIALEGCAIIYIIVLGVQYAKSENGDKRSEVKKRIVNLAIGAVTILVLLVLCKAIAWDSVIKELFGYLDSAEWGSAAGSGSSSGGGSGDSGISPGTGAKPGTNTDILNMIKVLLHKF